jgi:hypothetical protein
MPVEIEKEVTTQSSGPNSGQVSQTATTTQAPTNNEQQDAKSDRKNAWIWYVVGIIDLLVALRLVFHLFGARSVGFASMLYSITGFFVAPFKGIFANPKIEGSYFDMASLVAIIVYALLGWIIARLIDLATRPTNSKKV